jgi:hypothetical protein
VALMMVVVVEKKGGVMMLKLSVGCNTASVPVHSACLVLPQSKVQS